MRSTKLMSRLNSRAGVFALSLATWHGMRIVSLISYKSISEAHEADLAIDISVADSRTFRHITARCAQITSKANRIHSDN